jgi:hypothetical protein
MNLKGLLVEWGTSDKASINAAIEDIRNLGEINPFNSREVLIDNNVSVELSNFDGHLWINSIMTLERGRGDASRVLQKMCDIADKHQVYMGLGASPFGKTKGLNKAQLIAWYKRYGFKKVDYDTMERPPMPIKEIESVGGTIILKENYSFSNPQIEKDEEGEILAVTYQFTADKTPYRVIFNSFEQPRTFNLEFGVDRGTFNALDTHQMTSEGNALKILNTVANILNDFLDKFSGEYDKVIIAGTTDKRRSVYQKFFPNKISTKYSSRVTIEEGIDDPVKPGILKQRLGSLSCSKVRSAKSKLKDKGTHYAKALQRYLNYHC